MRLLLDTHAFIWWDAHPERLPSTILDALCDGGNQLFLSLASVWEMQIKAVNGKLQLRLPLQELVEMQCENGIVLLNIRPAHFWRLAELPKAHGDPFDRLLAAQAIDEGMLLVTADRIFEEYPAELFWE